MSQQDTNSDSDYSEVEPPVNLENPTGKTSVVKVDTRPIDEADKEILKNIISVDEVLVYYTDDGRVSLKVVRLSVLFCRCMT
jgi:hypothetical protein